MTELTGANTSTNFQNKHTTSHRSGAFVFKDSINLDSLNSDDEYSEK